MEEGKSNNKDGIYTGQWSYLAKKLQRGALTSNMVVFIAQ